MSDQLPTVNLDLLIIQGSEQIGNRCNVQFCAVGDTLVNVHRIIIPIVNHGVIGLHLCLPGTQFDILHRAIDPTPDFLPGAAMSLDPGKWTLHPTPFTAYQPLHEIMG